MHTNQAIARNIKRFRSERGITIADLGNAAGLSKQTIIAVESGKGNPRIDTITRIAHALGVGPRTLLTELGTDTLHSHPDSAMWSRTRQMRVRRLDQSFGSGYVTNVIVEVERELGRSVHHARGLGALRHCYVLHGQLNLGPIVSPALASPGDFVRFPADTDHVFEAVTPIATMFMCTTVPQLTMSGGDPLV